MPNERPLEDQYEDLLGLWSDLESALSVLLARPLQVRDFAAKVRQLDRWLQDLVQHDTDAALYLMFQLASGSTVGYSAAHALVCGTLCSILAKPLQLAPQESRSLVHAALTMNIGMTALQDQLALQHERPTREQQEAIHKHPQDGRMLLQKLGIADTLWLDVVDQHHTPGNEAQPLAARTPADRLVGILSTVDRYAAMISPRQSRAGRSSVESAKAILKRSNPQASSAEDADEVGRALIHTVGLHPPGTLVQLDNGETAIVLRRGDQAQTQHPVVASLIDRQGHHYPRPLPHHTDRGTPRIQAALTAPALSRQIDHRTLVRLGSYTAQRSPELRSLASAQGAR